MSAQKPENTYVSSQINEDAERAVLIITGDKCNEMEFFYPYYRFCEAGLKVDVASPEGGDIKCADGHVYPESKKLKELHVENYALLYLPGGKAPANLRKDQDVIAFVRDFVRSGKPVAAVCHGPQILAAANVVDGKRIAAYPEVEDELEKAGAHYVNEALVEDGQFITARWPGDLPLHVAAALRHATKGHTLKGRTAA